MFDRGSRPVVLDWSRLRSLIAAVHVEQVAAGREILARRQEPGKWQFCKRVHSAEMDVRRQANLRALRCNTVVLDSAFLWSEQPAGVSSLR